MLRYLLILTPALIAMLACVAAAQGQAFGGPPENVVQEPVVERSVALPAGISAELKVEGGNTIVVGDPVVLVLQLRNDGNAPFHYLPPEFSRFLRLARVSIREPGSEQAFLTSYPVIDLRVCALTSLPDWVRPATLSPGESAEFRMQVAWLWTPGSLDRSRGNRLIFSAPGDYEIGLSFRTTAVPPQWAPEGYAPEPALISKWEDMVWTDAATLKLRVELPEAQADRAAMEDFLAMEHLWMLYATPADVRRMLQEELIEFREKHGGSRYFKLTEIYRISAHLGRAYLAQDKQRHEALLNELETLRLNGSGAGLPPGWKSIADDLAATAKRQGQNMEALKVPPGVGDPSAAGVVSGVVELYVGKRTATDNPAREMLASDFSFGSDAGRLRFEQTLAEIIALRRLAFERGERFDLLATATEAAWQNDHEAEAVITFAARIGDEVHPVESRHRAAVRFAGPLVLSSLD